MNKYVLRTSLVWIGILAVFVGIWAFRSRRSPKPQRIGRRVNGAPTGSKADGATE